MNAADLINGSFEGCGAIAIGLSIHRLSRDKQVRGFHWGHLSFFTAWSFWNLYYYPSLDQWVSFLGGALVVLTNCVYLGMILYYGRR